MTAPVWTRQLALHINQGRQGSRLVHALFRDGVPSGIHETEITERPGYRVTSRKLVTEEGIEYDLLQRPPKQTPREWLEQWCAGDHGP